MKNLKEIVAKIAETHESYFEAKAVVKAYTQVLSESLTEGQRILLQQINDAHQTMRDVELSILANVGRCLA